MICTLDRDLSLFWFAGIGVSMNNLFNFPWERSTCFFGRHNEGPPLDRLHTSRAARTLHITALEGILSTCFYLRRHREETVGAGKTPETVQCDM